jgi:glutamine synthetase
MSFAAEVDQFLAQHPDTKVVEVLIADMNGIFRGKQMPISGLKKIASQGICFPYTTPFLTTNGANAEQHYDKYGSDPDRICHAIEGTLKPMPWAERPTAQVMVQMQEADGSAFRADARTALVNVLSRYKADGWTPVSALEFEFFLFEAGSVPPVPVAPPNDMPRSKDANCFNMDVFYDFQELLQEIESACHAQGIGVSGLVCEYGNGQFEVNVDHSDDVLKMCDDAMMLKRVVRCIAQKHGLLASFMAKPLADEVGSGMHAHVSVLNDKGQNIFAGDNDVTLKYAVGGLLDTMREATAFFAPNANSFKRFDPEWFAPVVPNWGENNRRLSVRLPLCDAPNRRFEHRVAGADACPYLLVAAILAGAHYGLKNRCDPGPELGEFELVSFDNVLPSRWKIALNELAAGAVMKNYFGEHFVEVYLEVRSSEEEEFHRAVTAADHEQYLRVL